MADHCPGRTLASLSCLALLASAPLFAFQPPDKGMAADAASLYLLENQFFERDLAIPSSTVSLADVWGQMPNAAAWDAFFATHGRDVRVSIDPRSGAVANIVGRTPLIPGTGVGNTLTLADLAARLGRPVDAVTPEVVADLFLLYARENQQVLGVDPAQLGTPRVTQVADYLWQIYVPQRANGIPVRHGNLAGTVNHGNLILVGTSTWRNVSISTEPLIDGNDALNLGFARFGGWYRQDLFWQEPTLEVVPHSMMDSLTENTLADGYGHRLVWSYGFVRPPDMARWEVLVDAHTGRVLSLEDTNAYATERITGAIYPITSTEVCPTPETCGTMQPNHPMPFANTGLAAPNNFTNTDGTFDYTSGTVTTSLNGRFVRMVDSCGAINASAAGSINLGGTNGQHDCTTPGSGGAGNTAASRSGFYELNKLIEMARGWLPTNGWLQAQLTANMNLNNTCNAFWNGTSVNFYRSGGGCRNTGEIAAVFDHEWGHGIDDNDANGVLSNSSEGYADIASTFRLEASCVGHGFFQTVNPGCGMTADGTGFNQNEAQTGPSHCDTDCSGVRDADWAKHANNTPDTPANFVCGSCNFGSGPCTRQVHCAAAPTRQAAWDFAARDLRAAPFSYDRNTAFIIANKIFYLGSGNVAAWHTCTCPSTSAGCGATNGYMQWLGADDDNGNVNDGTPHMTALFAAFNRHGIACNTPAPVNSGCSGGPTTAATLTVTPANNQANLSWTAVPGATQYWVFRGEGYGGCDFGKAKIATVTGTTYSDTEVGNGSQYCYTVVARGASDACFGPSSNCACVTPTGCPTITVSPSTLPNGTVGVAYSQTITASGGTAPYTFSSTGTLPTGLTLSSAGLLSGTPTAAGTFNFTVIATDAGGCTGSQAYSVTISCPTITVDPPTLPNGTVGTAYSQTLTASGGTAPYTFTSTGTLPPGLTLSTGGVLSGTPTTAGTFNFSGVATDALGCQGSRAYSVTIDCPVIDLSPTSLPNGSTGTPYSQTLTASGGTAPYTFAVTSGGLPPGLTLSTAGLLSGTPTTSGSFSFDVTATDAFGCTGTRAYTLAIDCPGMSVGPSSLPNGTLGTPYSQTVTATGGTPPYTYAVSSGSLPTGLSLDGATGIISGTPTAPGSFPFDITATDSTGCTASQSYTVVIDCAGIVVDPPTLPSGLMNVPYSQTISASGGTAPYGYAVSAGSLPAGLTLDPVTGVLSGTPTVSGSFPFTVTATDAASCTGSQAYVLVINCANISITPATLGNGDEGIAYTVTFVATGGTQPYTWSTGGNVPAGLAIDAATGVLSGSPTAAGSYAFDVIVTDAAGCSALRSIEPRGSVEKAAGGRLLMPSARAAYTMGVDPAFDYVVGEGLGQSSGNGVAIYRRDGTAAGVTFTAYGAGQFGTNVSSADIDGAIYGEVLTGPGPGEVYGPHVRAWSRTGTAIAKVNFFAYGTLKYGANPAGGDVENDGFAELVTGPGPGAVFGPHVRGWNYDGVALGALGRINFFAYSTLRYGANVEDGDIDADGFSEILSGPGPGLVFGPQVRGWNDDGTGITTTKLNFFAFSLQQYGCRVAGGDVDGNGRADVAAAQGAGPTVPAGIRGFSYDGSASAPMPGFDVTPFSTTYGATVGLGELAADGGWDLVAGAGPSPFASSQTLGFTYGAGTLTPLPGSGFQPFAGNLYGVTAGAGACGHF